MILILTNPIFYSIRLIILYNINLYSILIIIEIFYIFLAKSLNFLKTNLSPFIRQKSTNKYDNSLLWCFFMCSINGGILFMWPFSESIIIFHGRFCQLIALSDHHPYVQWEQQKKTEGYQDVTFDCSITWANSDLWRIASISRL